MLAGVMVVPVLILLSICDCREVHRMFEDYMVKAQCQARCNGEYGKQPKLGATEFFDVYPSYICNGNLWNCTQCSLPCSKPHTDMATCLHLCESGICNASCVFYYKTKTGQKDTTDANSQLYLTQPIITCTYSAKGPPGGRDVHLAYLRWNVRDKLTNTSTSSPLCFIVSIQSTTPEGDISPWKLLGKTNFSFIPATKLIANSRFRFNVTAVGEDGKVDVTKVTEWAQMPVASLSPQKPSEVKVVHQELRHGKVSALVKWRPGQRGGCFFRLYWMGDGDDPFQARDVSEWPEFKYELNNLKFGTNYSVQVHTFDKDYNGNSDAATVNFRTLTCLDNTNYSYIICEPDPPRNLTTVIFPEYVDDQGRRTVNVTLSWLKPIHASRQNKIIEFAITWHKKPPLAYSKQIEAHHGETHLDGRSTGLTLPNLHMDSEYLIKVKAVSGGGESDATLLLELGSPYKDVLGMAGNVSAAMNTRVVSSLDKNVYILALLPAGLACIAAIMYYTYRRHFRTKPSRQESFSAAKQEMNPLYGSVEGVISCQEETTALLPTDDYEMDPTRLRFVETLGEGAFGKVMRADLEPPKSKRDSSPRTVAVKILKDHATADERRSLLLEIDVMKQLCTHQNVVNMIGCCTIGVRICLIMDFCPLGDLRNYLREYREKHLSCLPLRLEHGARAGKGKRPVNSDSGISQHSSQGQGEYGGDGSRESRSTFASLPSCDEKADGDVFIEENFINQTTLLSYARQIALGMEFLSGKKFVHRDLAARNILVHNHRLLKISDFGLSRDVYETNIYQPTSARKLPYKWMPLESIFDHMFTTKSDVWSFGIVLWEIVTLGGCPYPGIPNRDLFHLLKDGYRMEKPDNCSHEIYQMMLSCWHPRPEDRPFFAELRYKLESLLEATRSYIDLTVNVSPDYYAQDSSDERETSRAARLNASCQQSRTSPNGTAESNVHQVSDVIVSRSETYVSQSSNGVSRSTASGDSESGTECSFQSQDDIACNCEQEVTSEYDLDPESDSSTNSFHKPNSTVALMKAPSLRNGMITLLGKMAKRGQVARLKNQRHSLSLSEVFNITKEDHQESYRTGSSGFLAL